MSSAMAAPAVLDTTSGGQRLNVLILEQEPPIPADSGRRIRTWNLLRPLASRHNLTVLTYEGEGTKALESAGMKVVSAGPLPNPQGVALYVRLAANLFSRYPFSVVKYQTARYLAELDRLLRTQKFDVVHAEGTLCAGFLEGLKSPSMIATHNIETRIWERRASVSKSHAERVFFGMQASKMQWFERRVFAHADAVVAVSDAEVEEARVWGAKHAVRVDNGVDIEYFRPSADAGNPNEILFLGTLDWFPNVDAVEWMVDAILPLIRARQPGCVLRVVGRRVSEALKRKVSNVPGVDLVGEVPDVRPYVASAAVVVVPLRVGGGSRIKILESFAATRAVVSTTVGAEGLEIKHGEHLVLADTPQAFAAATLDLLGRPEERTRLGLAGRALVERRYSWAQLALVLEKTWMYVARQGAKAGGA